MQLGIREEQRQGGLQRQVRHAGATPKGARVHAPSLGALAHCARRPPLHLPHPSLRPCQLVTHFSVASCEKQE